MKKSEVGPLLMPKQARIGILDSEGRFLQSRKLKIFELVTEDLPSGCFNSRVCRGRTRTMPRRSSRSEVSALLYWEYRIVRVGGIYLQLLAYRIDYQIHGFDRHHA